MDNTKHWKIVAEKRDAYMQEFSLNPCSGQDFVFNVLNREPTDFEYNIIVSLREVIAQETKIPVEYICPDAKCKIYADIMGPDTFWSYYLMPLFGLIGFDYISFLTKFEYIFESKTGHSITLDKLATQTLSCFDRKNHSIKEWILECVEKITHCPRVLND